MAPQESLSYESGRSGIDSTGRGSVVNLGSVNSYVAAPAMMPYAASKHVISGLKETAGIIISSWRARRYLMTLPSSPFDASLNKPSSTISLIALYSGSPRCITLKQTCQSGLSFLGQYSNDAGHSSNRVLEGQSQKSLPTLSRCSIKTLA